MEERILMVEGTMNSNDVFDGIGVDYDMAVQRW